MAEKKFLFFFRLNAISWPKIYLFIFWLWEKQYNLESQNVTNTQNSFKKTVREHLALLSNEVLREKR